jgi:hypothetical protein
MTDVVEIAKKCRVTLVAEIAKLDEFIRMAEKLLKYNRLESSKVPDTEPEKAVESTGPATARPYSVAAGADGAEAKALRP